jgi:glucose/arabinose dehydrogenase
MSASNADAQATTPIVPGALSVTLQNVFTIPGGGNGALDLSHPNDGRLYVAARNGTVMRFGGGGATGTFLNAATAGINLQSDTGGGERGLLGIAFHPNYLAPSDVAGSGKFYTFTSEYTFQNANASTNLTGLPTFAHTESWNFTTQRPINGTASVNHFNVVREWTADANKTSILPNSSRVLIRMAHPQNNHNAGGIKFGPDNLLYVATGDGGGSNDNSGGVNSTTDGHTNGSGNAQDVNQILGKILRVDPTKVIGTLSANGEYSIPATNVFAGPGVAGLDEIYAYGLRNPYRLSFDKQTGDLWVGDVGQSEREEVDKIASGGNYGWGYREGSLNSTVRTAPGGFTSIAPIVEYETDNNVGVSVIGGFVYRGTDMPGLAGKYIFGDYRRGGTSGQGRLFYLDPASPTQIFEFSTNVASINGRDLFGFGQDARGELYALWDNGDVTRIVPEPTTLGALSGIGATLLLRRRRRPSAG